MIMKIPSTFDLSRATDILKSGGVIVMPTDTVYGLVCRALDGTAVGRLFEAKKREHKIGTLLFADEQQLIDFGFDQSLIKLAMIHWPGPVSVILPAPEDKLYLAKRWGSLAVRVPDSDWLLDFLQNTGPLATTSANQTGQPTAISIHEAVDAFGGSVDLYVNGGEIKDAKPSKIIRLNKDGSEQILRG